MYETELKNEVSIIAQMLVRAGLIEGFGHVSLRTKEGFLITTTRPMKNISSKDIIQSSMGFRLNIQRYAVEYGIRFGPQALGIPQMITLRVILP